MSRALLIQLYGRLASLHPRAFRTTFAGEMQQVFAAQLTAVPSDKPWSVAALCSYEFAGLFQSIAREHWATATRHHKRTVGVGLALYILSLLLLALGVHQASPGPDGQALQGVAIGRHDAPGGVAYLSGRRLDCAPAAGGEALTRCTVIVAGEPLELFARRAGPGEPNQLGGICSARYAGREWPCSIGLRHVHVPWFAVIAEPLDLSPAQLEILRRQHPLENLSERTVWAAMLLVPMLTGAVLANAITLWFRGSRRQVFVITASIFGGAGAWASVLTLTFYITRGFWD